MTAVPPNPPQHILDAMRTAPELPLFRAATILGDRMAWKGQPPNTGGGSISMGRSFTCWSLDGGQTHATHGEIMTAAGIE